MDILRGRAFLFDRTFQIQENSRVTFEDTEYPNPQLDITMMTRIAVPKFEQEDVRSEEELYLHVGGTLENPEFSVADTDGGSDLTEEDILPLLVANYYGSGPDQSVWTQRAISFLSSPRVTDSHPAAGGPRGGDLRDRSHLLRRIRPGHRTLHGWALRSGGAQQCIRLRSGTRQRLKPE